jgi:hypothetical protein
VGLFLFGTDGRKHCRSAVDGNLTMPRLLDSVKGLGNEEP